jgi:lipoate-protein ligase A
MKYCELTLPTAAENLACDEALLELCEEGVTGELLRFWEPSQPFVVVGYGNHAESEVNLPFCEQHEVPVLRRCTGGGTVLQGPGCLNYSLILKIENAGPLQSVSGTNRFVMQRHQLALANLLSKPIEVEGHTDLAIGGLKFSGNAQRRKKDSLIFHGSFLLNFDIGLVEKTLRLPSKQPSYRANRTHSDFLMNLAAEPSLVKETLRVAWEAAEPFCDIPSERILHLVAEKYGRKEWNFRR